MADEYKRLLAWAKKEEMSVEISKTASGWSVGVEIDDPVAYKASHAGNSLDDAAKQVIEQLEMVTGGTLEEITGESPFGVA